MNVADADGPRGSDLELGVNVAEGEGALVGTDYLAGIEEDAVRYGQSHGASEEICARFAAGLVALAAGMPDSSNLSIHFHLDAAMGALVAEFRGPGPSTDVVGVYTVPLDKAPRPQREDSLVLAAGIAHDLRAPLGTIRTYATVLSRMLEGENAAQYADGVLTATARLSGLLDGLLGWVRSSSPQPGNADANDAVSHVLQDIRAASEHADVEIVVGLLPPAALPWAALVQVFQNLVGNAVKHSGRSDVHITISGDVVDGHAVYRVADNGRGVSPHHRRVVFDLFQRGDAQSEGSGVGLALVRRIVEQYHGAVVLSAEREQGAEFVVTLPLGS